MLNLSLPRTEIGPPWFWYVCSGVAFVTAAVYGARWYISSPRVRGGRDERYLRAVYGGIAFGVLCLVRAQTVH